MQTSLNNLLDTAIAAAMAAGAHALKHRARRSERMAETAHDVKLLLDFECQQIAEQTILKQFPDHDMLGEESPTHQESNGYQWIIDPIDGTVNFSHGVPYWCSSVAVRFNQRMLAGCVYAPELGACYTAHAEAPALKNGDPIRISETAELADALVFTGLSPNMEIPKHPHFEMLKQLVYNTRKIRINGSAALDICQVAEGHSDGYFEAGIHLWDYAAAALIAERAGASLSIFPNENGIFGARVLCSNTALHHPLLHIYRENFFDENDKKKYKLK